MKKRVLYTVNTGSYDRVKPIHPIEGWRLLYFTDCPTDRPSGWEIVQWDPKYKEPPLSSRLPKILPWEYFDYDLSLYMDGRFTVGKNIGSFLNTLDKGFHTQRHWCARGVYDEAIELILKKRPHINNGLFPRVLDQIRSYQLEGIPYVLPTTNNSIIVRSNEPWVRSLCSLWWDEYYRWQTWSDQMALWAVAYRSNATITRHPYWTRYFKKGRHATNRTKR